MSKHDHHIYLKIQDNGVGFNMKDIYTTNGLKNMDARAKALRGRFGIFSSVGGGTVINVEIPVGS